MLNTSQKIAIARGISAVLLRLGRRPQRRIRRRGIWYDVDLREGIDLSLFLTGGFQQHVLRVIKRLVPEDGVVIDIGANLGVVTLPAAAYLRRGRVFAVEPTDFAHEKLLHNLELNPGLAERVEVAKVFIAKTTSPTSDLIAYSSWPVAGDERADAHAVHHGVPKQARCGQTKLDDFIQAHRIDKVSLIKIDTDGHEYDVLAGARRCLAEKRPAVIFEACEYLMRAPRPTFPDFEELFRARGYAILDHHLRPIDDASFLRRCPAGGGLDLVAMPL